MSKSLLNENDFSIKIIGGLPEPIGGVTSFIHSLVCHSKLPITEIIDLYPHPKKEAVPIKHTVLQGNIASRILRLFALLTAAEKETIHFNFSRLCAVLLLLVLPKRQMKTWYLMLHHGELETEFKRFPYPIQFLIRFALSRKVDGIFAGSDRQQSFYNMVTSTRSIRTQPFILGDAVRKLKLNRRDGKPCSFLISGYPTEIYQHIEVLQVFEKLSSAIGPYTLNVVLYGISDGDLSNEIIKRSSENSNVVVHKVMAKQSFQAILDETDCYIRMNTVDSYGLVVAEAIASGATVIASDVCERYPGTYLIASNDLSKLSAAVLAFSYGESLDSFLPKQGSNTGTMSIEDAYSMLRSNSAV